MSVGAAPPAATGETVVYRARRVRTLQRARPLAEAVAVRDGRILAVGSVAELDRWSPDRIDDRYAADVVVPGFIEAHSHVMTGGLWQFPYVGYFDRVDPAGRHWEGCRQPGDVLERLVEAERALDDPGEPLVAWGLDPIYFPGERLVADHLDRVSATRPVFVFHASGHLATVNRAMLAACGIDETSTTPGVARGADGRPNGELQEPPAMGLARLGFAPILRAIRSPEAIRDYARVAQQAGHTFIAELGTTSIADDAQLDRWRAVTAEDDFPARVMLAAAGGFGGGVDPATLAERTVALRATSADRLHFGVVKLILDGSIQGFTARLEWPFYHRPPTGHGGNGLWLLPPEQLADLVTTYHEQGLIVHCHCNGDQASEVFIDAVATALERHPRPDHRHTVQHGQLITPAQYRRMGTLGMAANLFTNHLFHWGDQHRDITVGPDRAARMNACRSALAAGVPLSFHSDAPITPIGHLHTMWCAVNRTTATGDVLGPDEAISAAEALEAATLGAAWQLGIDHLVGSIEAGKLADFTVLDADPLEVDPATLRDIGVRGTVLGGVPQPT